VKSSKKILEKDVYDFFVGLNVSYHQNYCNDFYKQKYVHQKCGCQSEWYRKTNETIELCDSNSACPIKFLKELYSFGNYSKKCPIECNLILNNMRASFVRYPSIGYMKTLKKHPIIKSRFEGKANIEDVASSVLSFALYYQDFSYSQFKEVPLESKISLVSKIGGTLGLFLGMSLLSFIEIFEFIIEIIIHFKSKV
jgi:hypothetical protein